MSVRGLMLCQVSMQLHEWYKRRFIAGQGDIDQYDHYRTRAQNLRELHRRPRVNKQTTHCETVRLLRAVVSLYRQRLRHRGVWKEWNGDTRMWSRTWYQYAVIALILALVGSLRPHNNCDYMLCLSDICNINTLNLIMIRRCRILNCERTFGIEMPSG